MKRLKLHTIAALLLAAFALTLAPAAQWSGTHPKEFAARSDARVTEYMAGGGIEVLTQGQYEGIVGKYDGNAGPLQSHRYLTPWLLKRIPGDSWRVRWIRLAVVCILLTGAAAFAIGFRAYRRWEHGLLCVALALGTVGWQIARIPWHKDTVVTAIEWVIIACVLWRKWTAVAVLLVVGVLAKESFFFLAWAVALGVIVNDWRRKS